MVSRTLITSNFDPNSVQNEEKEKGMAKGTGQASGMARLQNIKVDSMPKGKKCGKGGKKSGKGGKGKSC